MLGDVSTTWLTYITGTFKVSQAHISEMLASFNSMELSRSPPALSVHILAFVVAQCQEKVGNRCYISEMLYQTDIPFIASSSSTKHGGQHMGRSRQIFATITCH